MPLPKHYLDAVLVPLGLLVLLLYHLWLLRLFLRSPTSTVMGINALNRRAWIRSMMSDPTKNGILTVQTLRNNIMASTLLASMAIMLSSLIAVLMANGWGSESGSRLRSQSFVVGTGESDALTTAKFFAILFCFLTSFLFHVQCVRYYSHAGILINVPMKERVRAPEERRPLVSDEEYVWKTLNRGSLFWSLGLRAFYFSFPLFLWLFGPIPLFVCCVLMVCTLYFLDVSFENHRKGAVEGGGAAGSARINGDDTPGSMEMGRGVAGFVHADD